MKYLLQNSSAVSTRLVYQNAPSAAPAGEPDVPEHLAETITALETVESSVRNDLEAALNQLLPDERERQRESVQALLTLLENENSMGRDEFISQFNALWENIPDNLKTRIESSIETIDVGAVVSSVETELGGVVREAQLLLDQGESNEALNAFIEARTTAIMSSVLGLAEGLDADLQNQVLQAQADFFEDMRITITPGMTLTEALTALGEVDFTDAIRANLTEQIQQAEVPTEAELNNIMARLEGLSSRLQALDGSATEVGVETAVFESLMGEFNAWWRHNEQAVVALAQASETEDVGMLQQLSMVLDNFMGNGVQGLDPESALGWALRGVDGVSANLLDPATLQAAFLSGGAEALRTQIETALRAKVTTAITPENFQSIVDNFSTIENTDVADQEALLALLQQVPEHWSEGRIQQYQEYVEATGRGALSPLAWRAQEISEITPAFMQALAELMDKLGPILAEFKDIFKPDESDTGAARAAAIDAVETGLTDLRSTAETESAFLTQRSSVASALQAALGNGSLRIADLPEDADEAAVTAFMEENFPNASAAEDLTAFNNVLESSDATVVAARAFGLELDTLLALSETESTVAIEGETITISVPVEGEDDPQEMRFVRNAEGRLSAEDETELRGYLEGGSVTAEVLDSAEAVEVANQQAAREVFTNEVRQILLNQAVANFDEEEVTLSEFGEEDVFIDDNGSTRGFSIEGGQIFADLDSNFAFTRAYDPEDQDLVVATLEDIDLASMGLRNNEDLLELLRTEFSGQTIAEIRASAVERAAPLPDIQEALNDFADEFPEFSDIKEALDEEEITISPTTLSKIMEIYRSEENTSHEPPLLQFVAGRIIITPQRGLIGDRPDSVNFWTHDPAVFQRPVFAETVSAIHESITSD